ncbi:MAG: pyocin knob domain-containing protein [Ruminococcus sp.]|nr:pyocin knob domain-containing protein [Ruminococcus sp.]
MNLHDVLLASKMSGKITGNADLSDYYTKSQTDDLISGKVDKEDGKGLSTNDFTNALKTKLDSLENYDDTKIKTDIANIVDQIGEDTTQITSIKKILDTSLVSRELLSGSTNDFNDVINSGQYKYNGSPVNKPETQTYGILLVFCPMHSSFSQGAMNYVIQIAFAGVNALHFGIAASAGVYVRSSADSGVTWSKWLKLAFEVTT